jgi:hypothetical protein
LFGVSWKSGGGHKKPLQKNLGQRSWILLQGAVPKLGLIEWNSKVSAIGCKQPKKLSIEVDLQKLGERFTFTCF